MSNINSDFAKILTGLYNGKRSEAVQTAETVNEMYDVSEDWNRQKQRRIYFELVNNIMHKKLMLILYRKIRKSY